MISHEFPPIDGPEGITKKESWVFRREDIYIGYTGATEPFQMARWRAQSESDYLWPTALFTIDNECVIYISDIIETPDSFPYTIAAYDLDSGTSFDRGYALHTLTIMKAMLTQKEAFKGAIALENGAGIGILGLFALKLGAEKVVLYERRSDLLEKAYDFYAMNGIDLTRIILINDDLFHYRAHAQELEQVTIGLTNLGDWDKYRNADGVSADIAAIAAMKLSPHMSVFIAGGYGGYDVIDTDGTPWSERFNDQLSSRSALLQAREFHMIRFIDAVYTTPQNTNISFAAVAVRGSLKGRDHA
ncbi:MAG TPA: hypothetical protein VMR81_04690 [Patescibacteria group bacterium]|nr:hypothetical protein [Patescibacteria group bacterium]